MEKLSYEMLLAPFPIQLSFGTLRKPFLKEIYELSFATYYFYLFLAGLTAEQYFKELRNSQKGKELWESLPDEEKNTITVCYLISIDRSLCESYLAMLNYFIVENMVYHDGSFIILNDSVDIDELDKREIQEEDIKSILTEEQFNQLLYYIRQICFISEKKDEDEVPVFKNDIAKRMYEKMKKADAIKSIKRNLDITLPNIISKVSNKHPTISPITVWDLTVFQLYDAFGCLQSNVAFDIQSTRVSVWGDEKNQFSMDYWYRNTYENK